MRRVITIGIIIALLVSIIQAIDNKINRLERQLSRAQAQNIELETQNARFYGILLDLIMPPPPGSAVHCLNMEDEFVGIVQSSEIDYTIEIQVHYYLKSPVEPNADYLRLVKCTGFDYLTNANNPEIDLIMEEKAVKLGMTPWYEDK